MKKIFLLGSLNFDLTICAPYLPEKGETLKGKDFFLTSGGKGANQAVACANLGGSVKMAGAVGNDTFGKMLLKSLNVAGVNISCVRRTETHTGVAVITVIDGDNRIILDEGANGLVDESYVDELLSDAQSGDIFVTQLENPLKVVLYGLKQAKRKGLLTVFNPAPACENVQEAIQYSDLIIPNQKELEILTGKADIDKGCKELLRLGAKEVVVTIGEKGAVVYSQKGYAKVSSYHFADTVDTTGAGDMFCGGICVKLAEGASLLESARFASVCSGIVVTHRGAQVAMPTRKEVDLKLRFIDKV